MITVQRDSDPPDVGKVMWTCKTSHGLILYVKWSKEEIEQSINTDELPEGIRLLNGHNDDITSNFIETKAR